jgi:serine/threonine-protein kinase 24/25/MST4
MHQSQPELSTLLPASQPSFPDSSKLTLAQDNPHLKSHRRRQTSFIPMESENRLDSRGLRSSSMEHSKQLADVLYTKWAEGLKNRWPGFK